VLAERTEFQGAQVLDILVVGGGINGVGIARDAAGRGLSVRLVEKSDLAAATSSASSKLIHGGLRYLEHGAFRLVREALAEREVLLASAPHVIRSLPFVLPYVPGLRPHPDQALRHAEEAIAAARAASHPLSDAFALSFAAMLHQLRGEVVLCRKRAESALALATEQVLPYWAAYAIVLSGWVLVEEGQEEEGLVLMRAGIDANRATGAKVREPQMARSSRRGVP
jgi:FAD dependent oxidoreductase